MASNGIVWDDRALRAAIASMGPKIERGIVAAMAYHAPRAVAYARQNAPWTDRTSNARNALFARVERDGQAYRLIVAHGVPYGIWLEVRFSGRFAIIRRTVDHEGPQVMATARQLIANELRN